MEQICRFPPATCSLPLLLKGFPTRFFPPTWHGYCPSQSSQKKWSYTAEQELKKHNFQSPLPPQLSPLPTSKEDPHKAWLQFQQIGQIRLRRFSACQIVLRCLSYMSKLTNTDQKYKSVWDMVSACQQVYHICYWSPTMIYDIVL